MRVGGGRGRRPKRPRRQGVEHAVLDVRAVQRHAEDRHLGGTQSSGPIARPPLRLSAVSVPPLLQRAVDLARSSGVLPRDLSRPLSDRVSSCSPRSPRSPRRWRDPIAVDTPGRAGSTATETLRATRSGAANHPARPGTRAEAATGRNESTDLQADCPRHPFRAVAGERCPRALPRNVLVPCGLR
jgi:hypothetical protein